MRETIHDTQAKMMEWVAMDDLNSGSGVGLQDNASIARAEALLAMSQYLQQVPNTAHSARLRGVAQGMIRTCFLCGIFSATEHDCLLDILQK